MWDDDVSGSEMARRRSVSLTGGQQQQHFTAAAAAAGQSSLSIHARSSLTLVGIPRLRSLDLVRRLDPAEDLVRGFQFLVFFRILLNSLMILPQVHLRKPCYDFYFL